MDLKEEIIKFSKSLSDSGRDFTILIAGEEGDKLRIHAAVSASTDTYLDRLCAIMENPELRTLFKTAIDIVESVDSTDAPEVVDSQAFYDKESEMKYLEDKVAEKNATDEEIDRLIQLKTESNEREID